MDFMTILPYAGIIILVALNAWWVSRLDVTIEDED